MFLKISYMFFFLLIGFPGVAQQWSFEPSIGVRFERTNVNVLSGNVKTTSNGLPSFSLTINREFHARFSQGFGILINGYGSSWILEGFKSEIFSQSGVNEFFFGLSYHQRYRLITLGKYEVQLDVGSQFMFTRTFSSTGFLNGNTISFPFDGELKVSGKRGISPIPFTRIALNYNVSRKFSTFFRGQLHIGVRALYTTELNYTGLSKNGQAIINHRGTGVQGNYGVRFRM